MHSDPRTQYNKELFSQGAGNMLSGLLGGSPMTGVIVRSATNVAGWRGRGVGRCCVVRGCWCWWRPRRSCCGWCRRRASRRFWSTPGDKLVNLQNVKRLLHYGGVPVLIYTATVVMVVSTDLLTGIITGLVLSLLKVLYALSHLEIDVHEWTRNAGGEPRPGRRQEVDCGAVEGAATIMRLPKLVDTLESRLRSVKRP